MDEYEQWLRQLLNDLANFASARRATDQIRALEMIEYSTATLRRMLDAGFPPDRLSVSCSVGACQAPEFDERLEMVSAQLEMRLLSHG